MEIVKQLKVKSQLKGFSEKPNAVLIRDEGEEYPIFLESLYSKTICDTLLNSGYILCGPNYDFRKDGIKMSELPIEERDITPDEEQEMWDMTANILSNDELKSRYTEAAIEFMEIPPKEVTINTREELLKFLTSSSIADTVNDFLPLNYFTATSALFTIDEYLSGEYDKYFDIINARSVITYTKFVRLVAWAQQKGLPKNYTAMDFLDFYYQWGIPGLHIPMINKQRLVQIYIPGTVATGVDDVDERAKYDEARKFRDTEVFLVSNDGTILGAKDAGWKAAVANQTRDYVDVYSKLPAGETKMFKFEKVIMGAVTELRCDKGITISYMPGRLFVDNIRFTPFTVRLMDKNYTTIPARYWNIRYHSEIKKMLYLRAIAEDIIKKCKVPCSATSYKTLQAMGLTPATALEFIIHNQELDTPPQNRQANKAADSFNPQYIITRADIEAYAAGEIITSHHEEKADYFEDIISGAINIDNIDKGIQQDAVYGIDRVYDMLRAISNSLDISGDEIYETVKCIGDDRKIHFEKNGYKYDLELPELCFHKNGFNMDISTYQAMQANDGEIACWITHVADEAGFSQESIEQHVAFAGYKINMVSRPVDTLITYFNNIFLDRVEKVYARMDSTKRRYIESAKQFAIRFFFNVAFDGKIQFPQALGGDTMDMSERQADCKKYMIPFVTTNYHYCSRNLYTGSTRTDSYFMLYCVNAYVTPTRVIPKKGYKIKHSNFMALYPKEVTQNANVFSQLVNMGALPSNHMAWVMRYGQSFESCSDYADIVAIDMMDKASVVHYRELAEDFRKCYNNALPPTHAPRMLELYQPKLTAVDDQEVYDTVLPNSMWCKWKIAKCGVLDDSDIRLISDVDEELMLEERDIRSFAGFSAEDIYISSVDLTMFYINENSAQLSVIGNKILMPDNTYKTYLDVANLSPEEYPIVHISGNKYILRDMLGKYWEVLV